MKKQFILLAILSTITFVGCKTNEKKQVQETETKKEVVKEVAKEFVLNLDYPNISSTANATEIKSSVEKVTHKINQSLSKLKKKKTTIDLNNIPNTPLTIWYSNNTPIKVTHGVGDDSGKIDGEFNYYLKDGKIWYSDQIFARYLFDNNKLKYWMDEQWNSNNIPANDFTDRQNQLIKSLNHLLKKGK